MAVERKYERDIDLLLAEEFAVNKAFAEAFKSLTRFADTPAEVEEWWVSKSNNLGESDLIVVFKSPNNVRFALLIENKVDAPLQPDQAERYRQRAERDREQGLYGEYELLLCAPRYYIRNRSDLVDFDRRLAFEDIAELYRAEKTARATYRADFLDSAGTRRLNVWVSVEDAATNDFWNAAYELAKHDFPDLEMKRRNLTKDSTWITLRPHDLPTQPKRTYIELKGSHGHIDLTFANTTAYLFRPTIAHLLDSDMSVHQTGKAAAIRIETPKFEVSDGISAGIPKIRAAFEASMRLIALYRRDRVELDEAAKAATALQNA